MSEVAIAPGKTDREADGRGGICGFTSASGQSSILAGGPPIVSDHRMLRCIGQGGGGTVWLAKTVLGAYRAVKVVTQDSFADHRHYELEFEGLKAFESICRRHSDFLQIFHVGRSDGEGRFYYSMELADSVGPGPEDLAMGYRPRTLSSLREPDRALPAEQCLDLFLNLTRLLALLHCEGLIHRDLKPSNVLFVGGRLKLADVGLVTATRQAGAVAVAVAGTPGYAPPEGAVSVASDLYSMGQMLYEFLNGCSCARFPEVHGERLRAEEEPLYWDLNDRILRACHPDPTRRYRSATEMHCALRTLSARREPVPHRPWWSFLLRGGRAPA